MAIKKVTQDFIFAFVILLMVGGLIYTYRQVIGPLVIAALLAYLLNPVVTWIKDCTNLPRKHIVHLVYIAFVSILVLFFVYISPIVLQQARILTSTPPSRI